MTARRVLACAVVLVGAASVVGGCTPQATSQCNDDAQCNPIGEAWRRCEQASGQCLCTDDRACNPNETCNATGRCQAIAGCADNDDCGEGLFCVHGNCEADQVCGAELCCSSDAACPFNHVCDAITLACVPGCRDEADCILGQGCVGAGGGRLGSCDAVCTSDAPCSPGQLCNLTLGVCERDTRGPYCQGCSGECRATTAAPAETIACSTP